MLCKNTIFNPVVVEDLGLTMDPNSTFDFFDEFGVEDHDLKESQSLLELVVSGAVVIYNEETGLPFSVKDALAFLTIDTVFRDKQTPSLFRYKLKENERIDINPFTEVHSNRAVDLGPGAFLSLGEGSFVVLGG